MRLQLAFAVLSGLLTTAQFVAPSSSSSSSASFSLTSTSSAAVASSSNSPSPTSSGTIPPPPTESVGCVLHIDHYHCDGPASVSASGTVSNTAAAAGPSPTGRGACHAHGDHWHCEGDEAHAEGEAEGAEGGECIIHSGHTHGDCSAEQLACGAILLQDYNMPLHIGSIFIILISSALGVLIPMVSGWWRSRDGQKISSGDPIAFGREAGFWASVFFVAKHFGTGIIISTAFIHLLFHGFLSFQSECIGQMAYESTAAAIAMAGAFVTFLLDYIGTRVAASRAASTSASTPSPSSPDLDAEAARKERPGPFENGSGHDACGHHDAAFMAEQSWQVLLLEAGIIFHSIMIGVTLGAASGNGWTTLLIVIVFHQFFEGAALGARIALLYWISRVRAILMGLAFIFITPIGIAIGIGVRQSFSQNGRAALLAVGILNSVSAGILLYTAFKLLNADFIQGPLKDARMSKVVVAMLSLVVGIVAMSVLGKWA